MKFLKDWIIPAVIAIILGVLINKFLFFNVNVPTGSMYPTITPGDRIFSMRMHRPSSIERGDILVFHSEEANKDLIKRVIGLPGETVEVQSDGKVYINGEYLEEDYVSSFSDITGTFNVPEGCYLFLGDNRGNSIDARLWKNPYIPFEEIQGEGKFIIFPFDRFGKLK
ncbi:MAG TPA: signal peptidase I [Clostridium sp.]|nr:signal peptidase I [Clostridium sp.]